MKSCQLSLRFISVVSLSVLVVFSLGAPTAFSQGVGTPGTGPGPGGGPSGTTSIVGGPVFKTPLSVDGDTYTFPIDAHNSSGALLPNWAGVMAKVHVLDPSEVDVTAVSLTPASVAPFGTGKFAGGPVAVSPFGPASANVASSPMLFTAMDPSWASSGRTLLPSSTYPVIDIDVRVKGSNAGGNSDADISVMLADIYHQPGLQFTVPPGGGSTSITFTNPGSRYWTWFASGLAFVTSNITNTQQLHVTHSALSNLATEFGPVPPEYTQPNPLNPQPIQPSEYFLRKAPSPETGHWIHAGQTIVWHELPATTRIHFGPRGGGTVITLFGSFLHAVPFGTAATIGIDHIPEPTAPILLASGLVCMAVGIRSRRRRRNGE